MFNYMGCNEEMVEQGVKKFGPAPGARKMLDNEYVHAEQSIQSRLYITYSNPDKKSQCTRLGRLSRCFCSHSLAQHNSQYFGKKFNTACQQEKCGCKTFRFVPSRPEECGMYWLPRRKDFDVNAWRPPCKCKHNCEQHDPTSYMRCRSCKTCQGFSSDFACISCDGLWEHHEVLYEMEEQRKQMGKPVGKAYLPLATHQNIQKLVFRQPDKYKMIEGQPITEAEKQQMQKRHASLNPKKPTKQELQKIKSPLGFIFQPKYPDFMKK